jgi:hypothetical protein
MKILGLKYNLSLTYMTRVWPYHPLQLHIQMMTKKLIFFLYPCCKYIQYNLGHREKLYTVHLSVLAIYRIAELPLSYYLWSKVFVCFYVPYAHHHNSLLIRNRSWILTVHNDKIFWKNLLENKEMVLKNGVKNIQAVGYNGTRTVLYI